MIKRIKNFIEKYKNANGKDREYYEAIIEKIIIIVAAVSIPIILYLVCRQV